MFQFDLIGQILFINTQKTASIIKLTVWSYGSKQEKLFQFRTHKHTSCFWVVLSGFVLTLSLEDQESDSWWSNCAWACVPVNTQAQEEKQDSNFQWNLKKKKKEKLKLFSCKHAQKTVNPIRMQSSIYLTL